MKSNSTTLGHLSQISIGTSNLSESIEFWKKLGFHLVIQEKTPFPWVQFTDESILVYLIEDKQQYTRLTYFNPDIENKIVELEKLGVTFTEKVKDGSGNVVVARVSSPDNFVISIVKRDITMLYYPTKDTMLTMNQTDLMNPEKMPTRLGIFGEFCHPVSDLKLSIAFWKKLGFEDKGIHEHPYPWTIMTDNKSIIGLHQTKDFSTPAITFFAPDMKDRIDKLKTEDIEGKEMGMGADNIVVTTPEGAKIFLFKL